jgi:hypothetical protein
LRTATAFWRQLGFDRRDALLQRDDFIGKRTAIRNGIREAAGPEDGSVANIHLQRGAWNDVVLLRHKFQNQVMMHFSASPAGLTRGSISFVR